MPKINILILNCIIIFNFLCGNSECSAKNIQACLSPAIIINSEIVKQSYLSNESSKYICLPADAVPVPKEKLDAFVDKYSFFRQAYYNEYNPSYPTGCGSFSYFVGTKMVKELGDVYLLWSGMRDHYYLSLAVEMLNGQIEEVIIDYTADQLGLGRISPLIATRESIKEFFPGEYILYYKENSVVMRPEDMLVDNFFLELIQIGEIIFNLEDALKNVSLEDIEILSCDVKNNVFIEQAI